MPDPVISAPNVLLPNGPARPGWVRLHGQRIVEVGRGEPPGRPTPQALADGWLAPGFVDAQCNGAYGTDFTASPPQEWTPVLRRLPATGVTAVVPTIVTAPETAVTAALAAYRRHRKTLEDPTAGARALGVHLEGPFLAPSRAGAHDIALLCDPSPDRIDRLLAAATGPGGGQPEHGGDRPVVTTVTLAPERPGAPEAVTRLRRVGVTVSLGHTDATAAEALAAVDRGAGLVTHLFNAQRPLHHREPGVIGVALTDPRVTSGLIADLHHVDARVVRMAFAAAPGRIMLVTDATAAAGMPPGRYDLGGTEVEVTADGPPRRRDGTLAGSALTMDAAVRNTVACGVDVATALRGATVVPATALGRDDVGVLAPGRPADMVWLSDDLSVRRTWLRGTAVEHDVPGR